MPPCEAKRGNKLQQRDLCLQQKWLADLVLQQLDGTKASCSHSGDLKLSGKTLLASVLPAPLISLVMTSNRSGFCLSEMLFVLCGVVDDHLWLAEFGHPMSLHDGHMARLE